MRLTSLFEWTQPIFLHRLSIQRGARRVIAVSVAGILFERQQPYEPGQEQVRHRVPVLAKAYGPADLVDGKLNVLRTQKQQLTAPTDSPRGSPVEGQLRLAHPNEVISVAFSPDGALVLTGSDGTARIWDAATGQEIRAFKNESSVTSVAFSPDGAHVLTGSHDGTARIGDAATGHEIRAFSMRIQSVPSPSAPMARAC